MEDSKENETPLQTCDVEYEQGDRLFVTRILPEPAVEDLHATSTISQKLVEGACQALETQKGLFALPDVMLLENFLQKYSMGYILYHWISLLEPTLETSYRPQT